MSKLLFGRYTIVTSIKIENKISFLLKGIENLQKIETSNVIYRFSSIESFTNNEDSFITGYLVKYRPKDQEDVYNETTDSVQTEFLNNKILGRSRFLIYPASSIIIFKEIPNIFSMNTFIDKFCTLFERNHGGFLVEMHIEPIKEQYSFIERIKTFQKIEKIEITLFPSNPNHAERWKSIDNRLRNINISKYKEIQENKKKSSIIIDTETESKFLMSEDGYGESKASGIDESGISTTISTKKKDKNVSIPIESEFDNAIQIVQIVSNTLKEIVSRTQKKLNNESK